MSNLDEQKTLEGMVSDVMRIVRDYEQTGTNRWTHQTALIDLQYQLGSLSKLYLQLKGDRFSQGMSAVEIRNAMADELADIIACTLFISSDMDIDINKAWDGMVRSDMRKIAERQHLTATTPENKKVS